MSMKYVHPADQLVMFMKRIYDRGLTTMSGGNLSIKDSDGNVWITPAGVDKGNLTRDDIILIRPDGTIEGRHRPSSEMPFHLDVFKMRPDLHAVLHAHPPALVAFSIIRREPNLDLLPTVRKVCPTLKIAKYGVPGSTELADKIGSVFAEGYDVAILENHGVCIGADDMFTAFQRFETLNYSCELEILANKIGNIRSLPEAETQKHWTTDHEKLDDFIPRVISSEEQAARRDMITLIRRSYKMGLFTATHGTYSVRLSDGSFIITPFGLDRAYLTEDDLVRIKGGMKELGKIPSRAVHFHEEVYRQNKDVGAVLLAHPVNAMAFAVTDSVFDPRTIPESYIMLRDVIRIPYADMYGNPEKVAGMFSDVVQAMIVDNDSVVVTGSSLLNAFDRLEVMELTAHSIINSIGLDKIVHITDQEIADLKEAFNLPG
ncbi:MAG: class II aldolase/adducin family protein [Eubacterium sp.]|nr:class II aldolase/adducin family protein [Eubacterium sp.]